VAGLRSAGLADRLEPLDAGLVMTDELLRIHDAAYIARIEEACQSAPLRLDPDTVVSERSYDIARRATGGMLVATDAVMDGRVDRAVVTARPPGHHAEHARAMGFCLFNHIAIAADHLTRRFDGGGLQRVAIVDYDVHHGNGTQHVLETRRDVLFISIHQHPATCYPGTGYADECGTGEGEGFTLNVPMAPHSGDADYRRAFQETILPKLRDYKPQVLLISAGYDAATEDPLASIDLTTEMFGWMTRQLVAIADEFCEGRVISTLEGGYDLQALSRGVVAHVQAMIGD